MAIKMMREKRHVLIALSFIFFISSVFVPAGIMYPLKWIFIPRIALEIGSSPWSLVTGGIGFIVIAIGLLVLAKNKRRVLEIRILMEVYYCGQYTV